MEKLHHTLEDVILHVGLIIPPKRVNGVPVVRHTNMELKFRNPDGEIEVLRVATHNDIIFGERYFSAN